MKTASEAVVLFVAAVGAYAAILAVDRLVVHARAAQVVEATTMPASFAREARGLSLARITGPKEPILYEFFDYQCPAFRASETTLEAALKERRFEIVRLHDPLRQHLFAPLASRAAFAASRQGAFDAMHRLLMTEPSLSRASILERARSLRIDVRRFVADLDSPASVRFLNDSLDLVRKYKIDSTPSYFVQEADGRFLRVTNLQQAIRLARGQDEGL